MTRQDVRWQQRFDNYRRALIQLQDAIELRRQRQLSNLEKQGLIKAFEFTHELAWNVLKDFLQDQGNQNIKGSKDAIREAFKVGLIADGENWMATILSRNISTHTYQAEVADLLILSIVDHYFSLFIELKLEMEKYLE